MNTPASASAYQRLPSHGRDAVSYDKQTALLTRCYIIVSTAITNRKSANRSHLGVMAVSLVAEIKRLRVPRLRAAFLRTWRMAPGGKSGVWFRRGMRDPLAAVPVGRCTMNYALCAAIAGAGDTGTEF